MRKNIIQLLLLFIFFLFSCSENPVDSEISKWVSMESNTSANLHTVWGISSKNVYAIGNGSIYHYNGANWSRENIDSKYFINSIYGAAANSVYAVGKNGLLLHFNGNSWNKIETNTLNNFRNIYGLNNSTILIQDGIKSFATYYNNIFTPNNISTNFLVKDIWGEYSLAHPLSNKKSNNYIFVGGIGSFAASIDNKVVTLRTPTTSFLDVHGTNWWNVFAIGYPAKVIYFNGIQTNLVRTPINTPSQLITVWTVDTKKAYFAGYNGSIYYLDNYTWTKQNSGTSELLNDIWGSSDEILFIVGDNGTILKSSN